MGKKVKAVIFDMDGLLIDTESISFILFQKVFKDNGYKIDKEYYVNELIGRNINGLKECLIKKYGENFDFDKIYFQKVKAMTDHVESKGISLKEGVVELLDYLKQNNYKVAVATSTRRERAENLLSMVKIKDYFQEMVCGDEVINSKPNPEIFQIAAKKLGVRAENCIVLEDSTAGIEAAYNAGMRGINVPDMKEPDDNMRSKAYRIEKSLIDVLDCFKSNKI